MTGLSRCEGRSPSRFAAFASAVLAISLAACGGAGAGRQSQTAADLDANACPVEGEVRLGRICWNPVGSRWQLIADAPGGVYEFQIELLAGNRLASSDHPAASPARDEWFVDGGVLRLFLADRFVEYRAELTNGTVMVGEAINVEGQRWHWRGDRDSSRERCEESEARLGGACFSMAGTVWRVVIGGTERVLHFDAGGALTTEGAPAAEGSGDQWAQTGTRVELTLGGARYEAQIAEDLQRLEVSGGPSAQRVPLYPPPMH